MSGFFIVDRLRMLLRHGPELRRFKSEQQQLKNESMMFALPNDQLPWTMVTAFYASCGGGVVLANDRTVKTLTLHGLWLILSYDHTKLLPIHRAALQDPSKASGLAKFITCLRAFWFCSQCVARLSQNMAISLLELNTFAHCVSAFFIYVFWWHKPYDVTTHAYVDVSGLPQDFQDELASPQCVTMYLFTSPRSENTAEETFNQFHWALAGSARRSIMVSTMFIYGAVHLLAWKYHFPTTAERIMWRCASIAAASSGSIALLIAVRGINWVSDHRLVGVALIFFICVLGFVALAARSFLVIESFRALPNSPALIYEVPRFTAYLPHI
jgi:hypothetical protein